MLKRVVHKLGLLEERKPRSVYKEKGSAAISKASPEFSLKPGTIFVKIVHEGGVKELYQHAVPASRLMEKYPGMCVALPEVFKDPHQSVLWPEEFLLPGQKYILISCKAVEKLKRKHTEEAKTVLENGNIEVPKGHDTFEAQKSVSPSRTEEENRVTIEEAICSAKDFYVSKDNWTTLPKRKGIKGKKPFVPPLPKMRSFRSTAWHPSLSTVEELSH